MAGGVATSDPYAAPQLENIPWWVKNILRGENERLKGGKNILKIIKQKTIQKTSGRQDCCQGGGRSFRPLALLTCGPVPLIAGLSVKPMLVISS